MLWSICTNLPISGGSRWDLPKYEPSLLHGITMKGLNCLIACFCFYKMSHSSAHAWCCFGFFFIVIRPFNSGRVANLFVHADLCKWGHHCHVEVHMKLSHLLFHRIFFIWVFRLACSNWVLWRKLGILFVFIISSRIYADKGSSHSRQNKFKIKVNFCGRVKY